MRITRAVYLGEAIAARYFFRVLLEKLNSSMCAMCFPVGWGYPAPRAVQGASS